MERGEPRGAALWAWWAAITAAGWTLAGLAFASLAPMRYDVAQYLFLPISALGQWWLLRQHFARASIWLLATIAGCALAALGLLALDALPESLAGPRQNGVRSGLSFLVDGVALGVPQWLALRGAGGNVRGTARWILATVAPLAYFAVPLFTQGFTQLPEPPSLEREEWVSLVTQQFGIYGLLVGAATGGVLAWLVEQPRVHEESVY